MKKEKKSLNLTAEDDSIFDIRRGWNISVVVTNVSKVSHRSYEGRHYTLQRMCEPKLDKTLFPLRENDKEIIIICRAQKQLQLHDNTLRRRTTTR